MILGNWNLQRANSAARRERLRKQVDRIGADVWVFTETNARFGPGAEFSHQCHSADGRDGIASLDQRDDRWVSIHSRYPLIPLPTTDRIRTAAARISPPEQASFLIFGTVLPWIGSRWREFPAAGGVAFRAALAMQASDWKEIQRHFPDDDLFVIGDFNQDLGPVHFYGSKANREALNQALQDCQLQTLTSGEGATTWKDSAKSACIDHTCSSNRYWRHERPAFRWPDTDKPDKRLSDHFGVAVKLSPKG